MNKACYTFFLIMLLDLALMIKIQDPNSFLILSLIASVNGIISIYYYEDKE